MLGVALVALLAACTSAPPKPDPAATTPVPVVTEAQVATIMTSLTDTLATADASLDGEGLATRLEGPALDVRRADYAVAAAGHELPALAIERDEKWTVVSQTTTWPRVVLVSTEPPANLVGTARILVLRQDSPRDQYRLWGSAGLGSGMAVPQTTVPDVGSQVLALNDKRLVMPPADVLPRYADLLKNGDASEYAASFVGTDQDGMRQGIEATRAKIVAKKGEGPGEYTETFAAPEEPAVVLATADGGALVVGQLTTTVEVKGIEVGADDPMTVRVAALAGGSLAAAMTWTYTDVVVFMVPPAADPGPVVVVAYAHTVTAAAPL
jgi:hypothetical protein